MTSLGRVLWTDFDENQFGGVQVLVKTSNTHRKIYLKQNYSTYFEEFDDSPFFELRNCFANFLAKKVPYNNITHTSKTFQVKCVFLLIPSFQFKGWNAPHMKFVRLSTCVKRIPLEKNYSKYWRKFFEYLGMKNL